MLWSPISESCDVCHCTSLFRNVFKIKGTPENAVKQSSRLQQQQQQENQQQQPQQQQQQQRSSSVLLSSAKRARRLVVGMASSQRNSPAAAAAMLASPSKTSSSHENECSAIFSPGTENSTPNKPNSFKLMKPRLPLEEFDPNSQDSGYGGSCSGFGDEKSQQQQQHQQQQQRAAHDQAHNKQCFQFAEPLGVPPRRLSLEMRSPMKSPLRVSPQQQSRKRPALFRSVSSGYESTDDGFNDLIDMESLENDCNGSLPNGLSSLISGDIVADTSAKSSLLANNSSEFIAISTTPEATGPSSIKGCRPRLAVRRSLSLQIDLASSPTSSPTSSDGLVSDDERSPEPPTSRARSCLFRSPNASCSAARLGFADSPRVRPEPGVVSPPPSASSICSRKFKRPEPPGEHSPVPLRKRSRKSASFQDVRAFRSPDKLQQQQQLQSPSTPTESKTLFSPPVLQRSLSETEAHAHIKRAIVRSTTESDLTGDFSKPCVLPLADGQHNDLKSISADTLSRLIRGEFADCVADFKIVDCRYPYEFEAGHIDGALNLYTKEMIEQFLLDPLEHAGVAPAIEPDSDRKRNILVFHCEFSWERGPNLSRFLRNVDRQRNKEHYPALHYPEIYLLHGGYQKFYKEQKGLCSPQGYRPMRHPDHEADLKQFRSKSKSWQGEKAGGRPSVVTARANLKRLGF